MGESVGERGGWPIGGPTDVLTVAEIADWLRCSRVTVLRALRRGEIRAWRVGNQWRVERGAVEEWMERCATLPVGGASDG